MSPMIRRFAALAVLTSLFVGCLNAAPVRAATVTDVLGRSVFLSGPAKRIVLAPGRYLTALSIVDPQVADRIVGIGADLHRQSPDQFAAYAARYPALASIPTLGTAPGAGNFPTEQVVSLAPDLVILSRSQLGPVEADGSNALLKTLEAGGIPVVVVDFFRHPLQDTEPSMLALGQALGHAERAEAYTAFFRQHLEALRARLAGPATAPSVFLHAHAGGMACCFSVAQGTFSDDLLAAGGRNLATGLLTGGAGQVSVEKLLGLDPSVYVGTGGTDQTGKGGLVLGTGVTGAMANDTLGKVLRAPGLSELSAVKARRAYGLWHGFNDTPLNVLAVEVLAKWLHPDQMQAIDPDRTLAEINERFLAVPMTGTYWVGPL